MADEKPVAQGREHAPDPALARMRSTVSTVPWPPLLGARSGGEVARGCGLIFVDEAMDGDAVCFKLQMQKIPMEAANFDAATGCILKNMDDPFAHGVFKFTGTGPEIKAEQDGEDGQRG